jgi:diguanylate cyclase
MGSPFSRLDVRLRRLPDALLLAIGLAVVVAVALFKVYLGPDIPVADFFLIPVAGVAWLARSRSYGYVAAVFAAATTVVIAVVGPADAALGAALGGAAFRLVFYVVVIGLLGEIRRTQTEREVEARTDPQTGAANVRAFRDVAAAELERCCRYDHMLSLLYLDVDDFKEINDTFGHAAGDRVLLAVSHVMRCSVRVNDTVARIGGDEFVVLMPEANRFAAAAVARRVQNALSRVSTPAGDTVHYSIGLATLLEPPESVDQLLHAADSLMYRAKRSGKDRIEAAVVAGPLAAAAR